MPDQLITDPKAIVERWGEGFRDLVSNPRIQFTPASVVVKLKNVVRTLEMDGVAALRLAEPTVRDIEAMDSKAGEIGKSLRVLSSIAGMTENEVRKMAASDFLLCQRVVAAFLADAQETSGT